MIKKSYMVSVTPKQPNSTVSEIFELRWVMNKQKRANCYKILIQIWDKPTCTIWPRKPICNKPTTRITDHTVNWRFTKTKTSFAKYSHILTKITKIEGMIRKSDIVSVTTKQPKYLILGFRKSLNTDESRTSRKDLISTKP